MIVFRHWAKAWTGALLLLLAVVFVGSSYHVHHGEHSRAQEVAALTEGDRVAVTVEGEDGSPDTGDRHDKWACQTCTVVAQLIVPPILMVLTTEVPAGDLYRHVAVEGAGIGPPSVERPPMLLIA